MKKIICLLFISMALISFAQNFAFIKQNDVLKALPNYESNLKKADSLKKVFENDLKNSNDALTVNLNDLIKKYEVKENETIDVVAARMNELDQAKLEVLRKEELLIRKTTENYNLQMNDFYKNNIQNLLDKLNGEIEKFARANKLDAVYIYENLRPAIAFIEVKKDVTAEIIKRIK